MKKKYIKSYKLCRGENFKNINNQNNDNLEIIYNIIYIIGKNI